MEYQKQKSHDIEQNHRTSLSKLLPNHQMGLSMWVSVIYVGVMPQLYLNILWVISRVGLSEKFHLIAMLMRKTMIYFTMFKGAKWDKWCTPFHLPFCSICSAPRPFRPPLRCHPVAPSGRRCCWGLWCPGYLPSADPGFASKPRKGGEVWRTWRKRGESEEM